MGRKWIVKPTLATVFVFFACYAFFNTFVFPNPSKLDDADTPFVSRDNAVIFSRNSAPVKVYMYDLPRKFTYGVIESYAAARGALKGPVDDVSMLKYPGNQHPAEWYLFADLNRQDRTRSPVTRVLDSEEADIFYVPFFSSLSLAVNPKRPANVAGDGPAYVDGEMQEGLIEWLEEQGYWKRNNGWDHVFICEDPNALYKVVDRVKNGVLLLSDFGRLRHDQASLVKDVILPYWHQIKTFDGDVGVESRKSLLFFMGNRYRKEGGKIRDKLFQLLEKEEDVIIKHGAQSRESRRAASQGMHTSKFCLHPAGDTPSTVDSLMLFYIVQVKQYFEYEDPNGTVNEIWRQVSLKLPLIKLKINRDKRLVKRDLPEPTALASV